MKKGNNEKNIPVKDDQKYLEGINLVTGDKYDYTRHILTETEINALCISEKSTKAEKFVQIMTQGQKIQKWSMFQNLPLYVEHPQGAETIFSLIEKNYSEYEEFLSIMGQGFASYLKKCRNTQNILTQKCYDIIYRVTLRTITSPKLQGSQILSDWMGTLTQLFHFPQDHKAVKDKKNKLSELIQYINGSFSMNTLPERRKTALEMINALIEQSQEIYNQSHSKILFFNNDLNPSTRIVICKIMEKILSRQNVPERAQIWKCVLQYYFVDKSVNVKEKSFQIISQIYFQNNAEQIFTEFDCQKNQSLSILIQYLPQFLRTYENEVKNQPMYQLKVFSFLNRLLRKNMETYIAKVVECYAQLLFIVPESVLISEIELKKFNLESVKVMTELIHLYCIVHHIEFKEQLKKQIIRGLRYHEFYLKVKAQTIEKLIDIFELDVEEDIGYFILLFGRQVEESKWKNILVFLQKIQDIRLTTFQLEKIVAHIIKIYQNCPYFMLENVHKVILHLLLIDRKSMEIYIKIREKCFGSKNWMLRRNFIKLYTFFKIHASFQVNKLITPLVYKNIVNEKNVQIKMQFVKEFHKAYPYLDPTLPQEKISIKEVISRFSEDRDRQLSHCAQKTLEQMKQNDKDTDLMHKMLIINKQLLNRQILIEQVIPDQKKHVKTERLIGKTPKELRQKQKKGSMVETKTTVNLIKLNHLDKSAKQIMIDKGPLNRSTSTQAKNQKPKIFIPNNKKTRFY